jgi:hypothetical protein
MKRYITAQEALAGKKGQIPATLAVTTKEDSTKALHSCGHWHTYKGYIKMAQVTEMEQHACPKCQKQAK